MLATSFICFPHESFRELIEDAHCSGTLGTWEEIAELLNFLRGVMPTFGNVRRASFSKAISTATCGTSHGNPLVLQDMKCHG
jgi:hypothetical protein